MQLTFRWNPDEYNSKNTKIYFACPTGKRREAILSEFGEHFGACLTRDLFNNVTAKKMSYFLDNGAYGDFVKGISFKSQKFYDRLLEVYSKARFGIIRHPDFIVLPDIVAGGKESLIRSMEWMEFLEGTRFRENLFYLAVQDGMKLSHVEMIVKKRRVDGLFVGGTKAWKYSDGHKWVALANKYDLPIHIGGIGSRKDIEWAKEVGFTSVDSGIAMIHPHHLWDVKAMERRELGLSA